MSTALEKKRADNLKQAEEAFVKAQKFTKKTLTRWKPDWESAGRFYRDAVKLYKLAGDDDKTIQACRESAVAHDELGQFLTAATDLETAAALLAKDAGRADYRAAAYSCYRDAAINFRKNNSYERSAAMYLKAADVMDGTDQALALEALKDACAIFEDEQRGQFHDSTFKSAIGKTVKWGAYADAIAFMKRQNALVKEQQLLSTFSNDVYKNYLQIIVLLYHQRDDAAARDELTAAESAGDRFVKSDEYGAAALLVEAYEDGDSDKLGEALKRSPFKFIMNSIAVLARKLQMHDARRPSRRPAAAPGQAAAAAASQDEDEKDDDDFT